MPHEQPASLGFVLSGAQADLYGSRNPTFDEEQDEARTVRYDARSFLLPVPGFSDSTVLVGSKAQQLRSTLLYAHTALKP